MNQKPAVGLEQIIPLLATIGSLLLILAGTIGLVLLQKPLSDSQDIRGDATTVVACNESCGSNAECSPDHFCFSGKCRLADNPGNIFCESQPDQGLNFGCNDYCADSNECASEYDCFENRCRRPDSPDDSLCRVPSATIQQNIAQTCNDSCSSNAECELNMRCYQGTCRLATNPTNTTCQPAPTQSVIYKQPASLPVASPALPKGGDLMTQDASDSATPAAVITYSPLPTAPVIEQAEIPQDETALGGILSWLVNIGLDINTLSVLALGLGGIVLLVILVPKLFKKQPVAGSSPVSPTPQPTASQHEAALQAKLDELKQQQVPPTTPPPSSSMTARMRQKGVDLPKSES